LSLLTLIQTAADLIGIPRPNTVISSADTQVRQLLALANIEGKALAKRGQWQVLVKEVTHTTLAQEDQGAVATIAPGFSHLINGTLWNRTQQDPINGPLSPQQWQLLKASAATGPYYDFRIRGGRLLMIPTPPAGETAALEYVSKHWCQSADGSTTREAWAADSDTGILPEDLMTLGVRWRFLQAKGMDYGEAFRDYEIQVNDCLARDGGKPVLYFDQGTDEYRPHVRAPEGSWPLS